MSCSGIGGRQSGTRGRAGARSVSAAFPVAGIFGVPKRSLAEASHLPPGKGDDVFADRTLVFSGQKCGPFYQEVCQLCGVGARCIVPESST